MSKKTADAGTTRVIGTRPEAAPDTTAVDRVLLVNPPVVDTRFPWARWQQPALLLRYATHLSGQGAEVKLIDALATPRSTRLRREKVRQLALDGQRVDQWRFGRARTEIADEMKAIAGAGWKPSTVLIEGFTTFWWRGAHEMVGLVREVFPIAEIQVIGAYASLAPAHIQQTGATPVPHTPPDVLASAADWSLAPVRPTIGYLSTAGGTRTALDIVEEVASGITRGMTVFAFAEHALLDGHADLFAGVLEGILSRGLKTLFVATGTIRADELVAQPKLPALMRRAGYRQLFFADDRDIAMTDQAGGEFLDACHEAAALCHAAGFRARTDELGGAVSLGRAGEDLEERARMVTRVAHALGSVVIWPYQPSLDECPGVELDLVNGKLFPLRAQNGATYRDYLNVQGLGVVMNAKYREHTFDFLGQSLVARMFRDSLAREAWVPDASVKGSLRLPVLPARGAA